VPLHGTGTGTVDEVARVNNHQVFGFAYGHSRDDQRPNELFTLGNFLVEPSAYEWRSCDDRPFRQLAAATTH
jgi:hypothetical protein